jgi:hypothetical protein
VDSEEQQVPATNLSTIAPDQRGRT